MLSTVGDDADGVGTISALMAADKAFFRSPRMAKPAWQWVPGIRSKPKTFYNRPPKSFPQGGIGIEFRGTRLRSS